MKKITLPEREPYVAGIILQCLREWKRHSDKVYRRGMWIVTDEDLDFLEEFTDRLNKIWRRTQTMFENNGFKIEIKKQPSRK